MLPHREKRCRRTITTLANWCYTSIRKIIPPVVRRRPHEGFTAKHSLPFELLSDADHAVAEAYGCWGLKKFMGREYMGMIRTTFVINDGVIERIFDKVRTKDHFIQIMDSYK